MRVIGRPLRSYCTREKNLWAKVKRGGLIGPGGMREGDAYDEVIDGIGDVRELLGIIAVADKLSIS